MSKVVDINRVRRGKAELRRAVELGKARGNKPARPVPVAELVAGGRVTLTVPELATLTGLHPLTIRRAIASGELKAANGGGRSHYRISRADAETWWRGRGGGTLLGEVPTLEASESTPTTAEQAEAIWREMTSGDDARRDAALQAMFRAPEAVQIIVMGKSSQAAAEYYATPEGEEELADWRALDGEQFHDEEGAGDSL